MAGELEAAGDGGGHGRKGAAGQVVDAAAVATVKVMVVAFAGDLVAGGFTGDLHGGEPALRDEGVDVAVDGSNADAVDDGVGRGESFIR